MCSPSRPLNALARLGRMARDLVLPTRCPGCRRLGDPRLCRRCREGIPRLPARRCIVCGDPAVVRGKRCAACLARRPAYRRALAAGRYGGVLGVTVRALKYQRRRSAALALADAMADAIPRAIARRVDVVVSVPCHPDRIRRRGIDHTAHLARAVASALDRPWQIALARTLPTAPQVGLSAHQRRRNVSGAFATVAAVGGLRVLLVDDVLTTGATASACAAALCAAGARAVWVVTAARAVGPAVAARSTPRYNAPSHAMKETRDGC